MSSKYETFHLGSVDCNTKPWYTQLEICGNKCQFKIDTGADSPSCH
jgi:hypothetical protein